MSFFFHTEAKHIKRAYSALLIYRCIKTAFHVDFNEKPKLFLNVLGGQYIDVQYHALP